jgi:hypothetical protein
MAIYDFSKIIPAIPYNLFIWYILTNYTISKQQHFGGKAENKVFDLECFDSEYLI